MNYFARRNQLTTEFSGHEEVSSALRKRLQAVLLEYVGKNPISYGSDDPWFIEARKFSYEVGKEFPSEDPFELVGQGKFYQVFTVVEIFLDMVTGIYYDRRNRAPLEMLQVFRLSGSVYTIVNQRVELIIEKDLAEKLEEAKEILSPYDKWYRSFFEAVGNLVGRKAKSQDIVKDIFISAEGYLKELTGKSKYGDAVSKLHADSILNREQKAVMDKLNAYCSDAEGARHAGSSKTPNETDALWFLETVLAQLRHIHRLKQKYDQ